MRGEVGPVRLKREAAQTQLEGVDYAALEFRALAQILAAYPGARAVRRIHDEILIELEPPRSTDPLEWALYNQRVDRLRTEERIRAEKETKSCE